MFKKFYGPVLGLIMLSLGCQTVSQETEETNLETKEIQKDTLELEHGFSLIYPEDISAKNIMVSIMEPFNDGFFISSARVISSVRSRQMNLNISFKESCACEGSSVVSSAVRDRQDINIFYCDNTKTRLETLEKSDSVNYITEESYGPGTYIVEHE